MTALTERIRLRLARRRVYTACFHGDEGDLTPEARAVLVDLARFCRAYQSSVVISPLSRTVDTHASMVAEGRREVYNRIISILGVTEDQILSTKDRVKDDSDE